MTPEIIAQMIEAMADSHYRRDIKGQLALNHWTMLVKQIREKANET